MMHHVVLLSAVALASATWDAPSHSWGGGHSVSGIHKYGPAPLAHDGTVVDTADVAHAKAAHYAALAEAASKAGASPGWAGSHGWSSVNSYAPSAHSYSPVKSWVSDDSPKWSGPLAHIELTHDGKYVKDTPEVAHAKAEHLVAVAVAEAAARHDAYEANHYHYDPHSYEPSHYSYEPSPYSYEPSYNYESSYSW